MADLYKATIRNLPRLQAQALYRMLVNLQDYEPFLGSEGSSWSGLIPGTRDDNLERTITIDPMPTHEEVTRERRLQEKVEGLQSALGRALHDGEVWEERAVQAEAKLAMTLHDHGND